MKEELLDSQRQYSSGPRIFSADGATVEALRRPRGRPRGSKNKPKPKLPAPGSPEPAAMVPCVLELPPGADVIDSAAAFCLRRSVGLCVLSGRGAVSAVTLGQPSGSDGALTFRGRFDILSISATVLPAGDPAAAAGSFTVFLAGPQGQIVGGIAAGPLVTAGPVYLVAATFDRPSLFRLHQTDPPPAAEDVYGRQESPLTVYGGESDAHPIYSYQHPDVIWTPTAAEERQQPPY